MSAHQAIFPIAAMSRVLGVSKAGYYAWLKRPPSAHAAADTVLLQQIRTVHVTSRATYGVPRVHADLRADGKRHARKRIARLMRQAGLVGASRRRGHVPSPHAVTAMHALRRTWWTGISRHPVRTGCGSLTSPLSRPRQGFLYLAVVLDAWSRKIVGWSMANHLRTELVLDALDAAIGSAPAPTT